MASKGWDEPLAAAAAQLRTLLREVDACSVPLWTGPALQVAIFRYAEIFLPMYAVHLHAKGAITLRDEPLKRAERRLAYAKKKLGGAHDAAEEDEIYKDMMDDGDEKKEYWAAFTALGKMSAPEAACPLPPLDVAFVWALHRLSPNDYRRDCISAYGTQLPAGGDGSPSSSPSGLDYVNASNATEAASVVARLQWNCFARATRQLETMRLFRRRRCRKSMKTFLPTHLWPRFEVGGQLEAFELSGSSSPRWTPGFKYQLEAAAARQKQFLYNVSADYFDKETSMYRGVERYKNFLTLMRENPGTFLVPMYDIDLVWHAHILRSTSAYASDCKQFVGRFIDHKEDSDRTDGGELQTGFKTTVALWEAAYDEAYEDADTNYKGSLPEKSIRVFPSGIIVTEDADFRKSFVADAVCDECHEKTALHMHKECREELRKAIRMARAGQAHGGACAGMYWKGFKGSSSTYVAVGGMCGGFAGDPGTCAAGCGGGGGACGAAACGMGAGGCGGAAGGGAGGACGAGCGGGCGC